MKIFVVARREFITRVKKRAFVIMTLLTPFLLGSVVLIPRILDTHSIDTTEVLVIDQHNLLKDELPDNAQVVFHFNETSLDSAKQWIMENNNRVALLLTYHDSTSLSKESVSYSLYSTQTVGVSIEKYIETVVSEKIRQQRFLAMGIPDSTVKSLQKTIPYKTIEIGDKGEEKTVFGSRDFGIGLACGFIIYFFIFAFGSFVLQGVLEEKSNRIVEVIISTISPRTLLFGKILGIGAVGLFQISLWIIIGISTLTFATPKIATAVDPNTLMSINSSTTDDPTLSTLNPSFSSSLTTEILSVNFAPLLLGFFFYFIFGYIVYAGLFAAVGAAVNDDKDVQQFTFPITIPLLLTIILSTFIANNPQGLVSYWLSIFPLTSPVAMMIRLPFGVPIIDIVISVISMLLGTIIILWAVVKIYRVSILLYGKKPTYKDFWLWIRH